MKIENGFGLGLWVGLGFAIAWHIVELAVDFWIVKLLAKQLAIQEALKLYV